MGVPQDPRFSLTGHPPNRLIAFSRSHCWRKRFINSSQQNQGPPLGGPWLAGNLSYCGVKVTITLCVIDPETALTVTGIAAGAAGGGLSFCGGLGGRRHRVFCGG